MKFFFYTYETEYTKKKVIETYVVKAENKTAADYEMGHGCGSLLTESSENLGSIKQMNLIKVESCVPSFED